MLKTQLEALRSQNISKSGGLNNERKRERNKRMRANQSVSVTLLTFICQTLVYLFTLLVIQFFLPTIFFWYLHEPGNICLLENLGHIIFDVLMYITR
ncbi:hypothetical protein EB796_018970 [Bugula neritina]|uniref:Uncharacterized protein n=1 Tax=Bugula neritina TaxID=10212 RepID=A0A7J7JAL1_BUGNE|nr:hypothetical protein EB796_018970 [Bugula neritina]